MVVLVLLGCASEPCPVERTSYRIDSIQVGTTSAEVVQYGLNIDGDPQNRVDNQLGSVRLLLTIVLPLVDPDEVVAAGRLDWQVHVDRCIDGSLDWGQLRLDDGVARADDQPATIVWSSESTFLASGGIGRAPIRAFFTTQPDTDVAFYLSGGVSADISIDETGLTGKLGAGVFASPEVVLAIYGELAQAANDALASDLGCPDSCVSFLGDLATSIDADHDGVVTIEEVATYTTVQQLFAPDADLFTADGQYRPVPPSDPDWDPDSLSIGFWFHASPIP